jgi:hypothetical protein
MTSNICVEGDENLCRVCLVSGTTRKILNFNDIGWITPNGENITFCEAFTALELAGQLQVKYTDLLRIRSNSDFQEKTMNLKSQKQQQHHVNNICVGRPTKGTLNRVQNQK